MFTMVVIKVLLFLCVSSFCTCDVLRNVGITGGHPITINQAPFMAQVRKNKETICGGSIIRERFILTAAHCLNCTKSNCIFDVIVGTDIRSKGGKLYKVEGYDIHPYYSEKTHAFDVCLIKLSTPIKIGNKTKYIKLAESTVELPMRTMLNVTGWGASETKKFKKHLMQASLYTTSRSTCQFYYPKNNITSDMICTSYKSGTSACNGDSGGPLTKGDIQVGVVLGGGNYCGLYPSVFTRVSSVRGWIQSIVGDLP